MMRTFFLFASLSLVALPYAEAAGGGDGVPSLVLYQLINVTILALLLTFLLRNRVRDFFKSRRENFLEARQSAENARQEAEKEYQEIADRLERLKTTAKATLDQARQDAEAQRQSVLTEATQLSEKIKQEAHETASFEIERAKSELRDELLHLSLQKARQEMARELGDTEQQKLRTEFVEKIQVVQ